MRTIEVKGFDILNKWFEISYKSVQNIGSTSEILIEIAGYFEQLYTFETLPHGISSVIEHQFGGDNSHSLGFQ